MAPAIPMMSAVLLSLMPMLTAHSGISTVRADRRAAMSAMPVPIRASTDR